MSNSVVVQSSNQINYQFKLIYAMAMIFVVVGHSSTAYLPFLEYWFPFSTFHLALFVFCSGYFYKESVENNVWKYILKKVKTLLVPLYIWNLFYALVTTIFSNYGMTIGGEVTWSKLLLDPILHGHQFIYNLGGWFVIPLFMIEIFNIILCKVFPIKGNLKCFLLFALYVAIGIYGNHLAIQGYREGWWLVLTRMLYLLPFFGLGMLYKNKLEEKDTLPSRYYFPIVMIIQLIIYYYIVKFPEVVPSWCTFKDGPIIPVICGFTGIAFWIRVARFLTPLLGQKKYVLAIANNTYSIMVNHFLGFIIVKSFFALFNVKFGLFPDFDLVQYQTNIWYYYFPLHIDHFGVVYVLSALIIPIYMQKGVDWIKGQLSGFMSKLKTS